MKIDWAVIIPLANESASFCQLASQLISELDKLKCGRAYFVVDNASKDDTRSLCEILQAKDNRFVTVWAPQNRNIVDAYLAGFRQAILNKHEFIVEMDGGLSHNPSQLPQFLRLLKAGNQCVFGSRFLQKGLYEKPPFKRLFLSRCGTYLSNFFLGTNLSDMTSGFQGFHLEQATLLVEYPLRSCGHFYQTEVRYLMRKQRHVEVPISYHSPSPRVSNRSIWNAVCVLVYYAFRRLLLQPRSCWQRSPDVQGITLDSS